MGATMPLSASESQCQTCRRVLPRDRFQARNAYKKLVDKCQDCRLGRSASRPPTRVQGGDERRRQSKNNGSNIPRPRPSSRPQVKDPDSTSKQADSCPAGPKKKFKGGKPSFIDLPSFKSRLPEGHHQNLLTDPNSSPAQKRVKTKDEHTPLSPQPQSSCRPLNSSGGLCLSKKANTTLIKLTPSAARKIAASRISKYRSIRAISPRPVTTSSIFRTFDAAISSRKYYSHVPPPGYAFSGPMDKTKSVSDQRRFLVPPGVVRARSADFRKLEESLERGMVSFGSMCLECELGGIHCTYGAGVRSNGKLRDRTTGICDYCAFTSEQCRGNGFRGNFRTKYGAHEVFAELLDRLSAQADTCMRAGETDRSSIAHSERILNMAATVGAKIQRLTKGLKDRQSQRRRGDLTASAMAVDKTEVART